MSKESKQKSFSSWYERNKDDLKKKRAEKYRTDSAYRQAALDRAAKQRASAPRQASERDQRFRLIGGVKVEVFRIGQVAKEISKDEQTIRLWESRGIIPKPSAPGSHRYYTAKQVGLLRELSALLGDHRYDAADVRESLSEMSKKIYQYWRS